MIKQLDASRYAIDFGQVKRPNTNLLKSMFGGPKTVEVDAFAVGQALRAVLKHCSNLDVEGRLQVWNDFRLFLDRRDYEALRRKAPTLQHQLGPALEDEVLKLKATYLGTPVLRLHVDEGGEVEAGHGVLKVDWNADDAITMSTAGEVTVRLDKVTPGNGPGLAGAKTDRAGSAWLKHATGSIALVGGLRHVLGRTCPSPGPEHVAIPGASGRINKRQVSVEVDGQKPPSAMITREPGESNPVHVNGQSLAPGQSVKVTLPAELVLSNELKLELLPC